MIKIIITPGMTTATIIIQRSSSAFWVIESVSLFVEFGIVILVSAEFAEIALVIVVASNVFVVVDDVVTNVLPTEVVFFSEVVAETRLKS